jgi:hypothetical protein
MTFEEFFLKKKIDLELFKKGNLDLYIEFKAHFEQMSDKSFDHTKKYWFNDLRRQFPLSEEKEIALKEALKPKDSIPNTAITDEIKGAIEVLTPKPAGFKPRFKTPSLAESSSIKAESETLKAEGEKLKAESKEIGEKDKEVPIAKPAGFKPRFKATNLAESEKPKAKSEILKAGEETIETVNKEVSISKPAGFKPRFKASNLAEGEKPKAESGKIKDENTEVIPSKPVGFKPRFKAGQTQIKKEE